ncbi:hypothetical protein PF005_g403 [Phytophthora fragariae]|uniref:Uncharacterized protein n=1 Tax=Phytophthora fragariae TaxID=53985 RepID=A0A6A4E7T5_9STRA|nr:hypothetical protein PF003_g9815 [Phytophthora fragariae]KAE8950113.1 hypothetical protein PF009_g357 [Phytophthora fragariae]KAE8990134.1 hypothetical protein PF011_g18476 [Phytophthora fragariae]KAE9113994.1 hypothetical protein PF007_g10550 [Phytophthora fragariae]KAE9139983.1 hypothetical protein PF010_g346 [Phytophthora fragariae]
MFAPATCSQISRALNIFCCLAAGRCSLGLWHEFRAAEGFLGRCTAGGLNERPPIQTKKTVRCQFNSTHTNIK